jgi:hypothetical protein
VKISASECAPVNFPKWLIRALRATAGRATTRIPAADFGGPNSRPDFKAANFLGTRTVPAAKSTSHRRSAANSPQRSPENAATVINATQLTKLGETDLAWIAADRGLSVVRPIGDPAITGSLFRSVSHALLSTGRYQDAVRLTTDAADYLDQHLTDAGPELLSVYGTLLLGGSVAAARANDAGTARTFLKAADAAAVRLGKDANYLWTAFGPTNVAIHRVATAGELGNVQVAIDLGPSLDTAGLPMERRVRHALEVSRGYGAWNRQDEALAVLLDAEQMAPEQVRHHYLGRQLVLTWIRQQRGKPSSELVGLARRLHVLD